MTSFPAELGEVLGERIIRLPSLSERPEDIPQFVEHFLSEAKDEFERDITAADDSAMERLLAYSWPGNIKELKILIEHVGHDRAGPGYYRWRPPHPVSGRQRPGPPETRLTCRNPGIPGSRLHDRCGGPSAAEPDQCRISSRIGTIARLTVSAEDPSRQGRDVRQGTALGSQDRADAFSPYRRTAEFSSAISPKIRTYRLLLHHVESTEFCTALRGDGTTARTIEHLMAVFQRVRAEQCPGEDIG